MENVTYLEMAVAFVGFLVRWLFHLNVAKTKIAKRPEDKFEYSIYFSNNSILIALSFVSTIALLLIVPELLQRLDAIKYWSAPTAFGCGMSNIELVDIFKRKFMDKVKKETDDTDKKEEQVKS